MRCGCRRLFGHFQNSIRLINGNNSGFQKLFVLRLIIPHDAGGLLFLCIGNKAGQAEIQNVISGDHQQIFIQVKMFDGKLNYNKSFKWDGDDKAVVVMSSVAFAKMTMLIQTFSSEVAWHGVAFRDAHGIIGQLVLMCIEKNISLDELSLEDYKSVSPVFEEDIYEAISMKTCVEKRMTIGAPGAEAMKQVIEIYKKELAEN